MILPEKMGKLVEAPYSVQKAILMGMLDKIGMTEWFVYLNQKNDVCRL